MDDFWKPCALIVNETKLKITSTFNWLVDTNNNVIFGWQFELKSQFDLEG